MKHPPEKIEIEIPSKLRIAANGPTSVKLAIVGLVVILGFFLALALTHLLNPPF